MKDVDLLTELRNFRDEFARSHHYNLKAIAAAVRTTDDSVRDRLVQGQPRRPTVLAVPRVAAASSQS
jgi:hypothetical protein